MRTRKTAPHGFRLTQRTWPAPDANREATIFDYNFEKFPRIPDSWSFSRASNATMWNAAGDLVYAPHNLCPQSSGQLGWDSLTGSGYKLNSFDTLPSGNPSVLVVYDTAAPTAGFTISSVPCNMVITGIRHVLSVTVKMHVSGTGSPWMRILLVSTANTANGVRAWLNTATGALGAVTASGSSTLGAASVTALGDGYFRVTLRGYVQFATTADATIMASSAIADNNTTRAGNGTIFEVGDVLLELESAASPQAFDAMHNTTGAAFYGPRFVYSPGSGEFRGLRVEGARTNLCSASGQVAAQWNPTGVSQALTTVRGIALIELTADGANTGHYAFAGGHLALASTNYCVSAYVASSTNDLIQLTPSSTWTDAANVYINFQFSTGTVVSAGTGVLRHFVEDCGGGLFRIALVCTSVAAPASGACGILSAIPNGTAGRLPAHISSETIVGGAIQCEQAEFPSSYIPTSTAAATRAADVVTAAEGLPGYTGTPRTMYLQCSRPLFPPSGTAQVALSWGNSGTGLILWTGGTGTPAQFRLDTYASGVAQAQLSYSTTLPDQRLKCAARLESLNYHFAQNGVLGTPNTTGVLPTVPPGAMTIGAANGGGSPFFGDIARIALFNRAYTNAELQELTT